MARLMSSRDRSHLKEFWAGGSVSSTGCEECLIDQWLRVSLIQWLSRSKKGGGGGVEMWKWWHGVVIGWQWPVVLGVRVCYGCVLDWGLIWEVVAQVVPGHGWVCPWLVVKKII